MCYQPRPGHRKRQSQSSQWWPWAKKKPRQWSCDKCTYSNSPNDNKCASCGKERKTFFSFFSNLFTNKNSNSSTPSVPSTGPSCDPSEWTCSQCTYRNSASDSECKQCSNCKAWDESMREDSYEMIRSPDDNDVIMTSHNGRHCGRQDGTPVDVDDVMIIGDDVTNDDVMIINDDKDDKWECGDCTLHNDIGNSKCSACGSTNKLKVTRTSSHSNPTTHWSCPHCTMHNDINSVCCKACKRNGKKKSLVTSFDPVTQWKCQGCSLHNKITDVKCAACNGRRDRDVAKKHDDVTANSTNQWQCIHCSLLNDNNSNMCSACGGIYLPKAAMVTREISTTSSSESSMRKTRLYTNHTAYISILGEDKRNLIDQDAMNHYNRILQFCKQVNERKL